MVFPSRDEINGRSFRSGDRMTLEVNFDADTLTIHRNKGRAESATLVKHGIPWSGPVYFACTLYNSNATAEILSSQIGSGGGDDANVSVGRASDGGQQQQERRLCRRISVQRLRQGFRQHWHNVPVVLFQLQR